MEVFAFDHIPSREVTVDEYVNNTNLIQVLIRHSNEHIESNKRFWSESWNIRHLHNKKIFRDGLITI